MQPKMLRKRLKEIKLSKILMFKVIRIIRVRKCLS